MHAEVDAQHTFVYRTDRCTSAVAGRLGCCAHTHGHTGTARHSGHKAAACLKKKLHTEQSAHKRRRMGQQEEKWLGERHSAACRVVVQRLSCHKATASQPVAAQHTAHARGGMEGGRYTYSSSEHARERRDVQGHTQTA